MEKQYVEERDKPRMNQLFLKKWLKRLGRGKWPTHESL